MKRIDEDNSVFQCFENGVVSINNASCSFHFIDSLYILTYLSQRTRKDLFSY